MKYAIKLDDYGFVKFDGAARGYSVTQSAADASQYSTTKNALKALQRWASIYHNTFCSPELVRVVETPIAAKSVIRTFGEPVTPGATKTEYAFRGAYSGALYVVNGEEVRPCSPEPTRFDTIERALTSLRNAGNSKHHLELVAVDTIQQAPTLTAEVVE